MRANMSQLEDSRVPFQNGRYEVVMRDWRNNPPKTSNSAESILITFTVTGPRDVGRIISDNFSASPKALWKIRDILMAIGWPLEKIKRPDFDFKPDVLSGWPINVLVENVVHGGQMWPSIRQYSMSEQARAWIEKGQAPPVPQHQGAAQTAAPRETAPPPNAGAGATTNVPVENAPPAQSPPPKPPLVPPPPATAQPQPARPTRPNRF